MIYFDGLIFCHEIYFIKTNYIMLITKLNKLIEILLFAILLTFPFSYINLNGNWNILFGLVLMFIIINLFLNKYKNLEKPVLLHSISIIFLLIFDYTEKVNFSEQFNVQNPVGWRMPLTTILLLIGAIFLIIKVLIEKRLIFNSQEYMKNFVFAIMFIIILMILFYPFLKIYYSMSIDSNTQLLNKVLKYFILLVLIFTYSRNESCLKRLSIVLIVNICAGLILNIIL